MKQRHLVVFRSVAVACMAVACFVAAKPAAAQIPTEAGPAFDAFNKGFLVQANGQAFYTWGYQQNSLSDVQWGWGQDYNIYPAEDHYEYTHNQSDLSLLNATLSSFLNSPSWDSANGGYLVTTSDGYNDDIGWTIQTFVRGYQFTGNQDYLTQATTDWNFVINNRDGAGGGLDPSRGGIWETNGNYSKCALSNSNFVYTGVALYQITGDANYLNGAENVYAWERKYLANTTNNTITYSGPNSKYNGQTIKPGQVSDCVLADSTPEGYVDLIYDAGGFLLAADELYRVTGNQQYYNDAVMVINHIVGEYNPNGNPPTPLGSSCEGSNCVADYWFTKGLAEFLTLTNGWWSAPNANWLLANAEAAWNSRDSYGLTWNQWGTPNGEAQPGAMDSVSAAAVWSQLPPPAMNLAGTYEIQNVNSGMVLNVIGGRTTPGTAVIQYPWVSGQTNSLWTFVPTSGGYYQIKNASTGQVLNVANASGKEGALVQEWPAQSMIPGNDQWMPVQNPDGTFSFYNLLSHFALDVPAASTASDVQLDQYPGNFTGAQKFNLIQPNLNLSGTYEIQNINSDLALNVYGGQTANGVEIIQWPFSSGETNAEWRFVSASPGYYRIQNVNSGLYANVTGASTAFGASLVQYQAVGAYNDQWRVVQNPDGTYSFYNALSTEAIDVPAASTTSGVQLDQYGENGTPAQKFKLVSQ